MMATKKKYEKTRKTLNYILSMFFVIIFMRMYWKKFLNVMRFPMTVGILPPLYTY